VEGWRDFFVAEVGAAAAFAGLLFVSLSVNQARILNLSALPERGLQALSSIFLVFALGSIALVPDQGPKLFGAEAFAVVVLQVVILTWLQIASFRITDRPYRRRSITTSVVGQAASWAFLIGSALLMVRTDWLGLAWYAPGVILAFFFAGATSWVLLIEINR